MYFPVRAQPHPTPHIPLQIPHLITQCLYNTCASETASSKQHTGRKKEPQETPHLIFERTQIKR